MAVLPEPLLSGGYRQNRAQLSQRRHIAWAKGFQGNLSPLVAAPASVSYGVNGERFWGSIFA